MRLAGIICLTAFALLALGFGMADAILKPHTFITLGHLLLVFVIGAVMLAASFGLWRQKLIQTKLRRDKNQPRNPFIPRGKYAVWASPRKHRAGKPFSRKNKPHPHG